MLGRFEARSSIKCLVLLAAMLAAGSATAEDSIAQIKVLKGSATVERTGETVVAKVGTPLRQFDVIRTGADSAAGITFVDNTVMSLGPDSVLYLDRFSFNPTTHEGKFDTVVRKGTLSVISGKIAKQSPEAMSVKTPASILGVRGTEFFVKVAAE